MNRFALLLLLGLVGRAHAAPDVGVHDALGRPIALPVVELPGSVTRNALGLPATVTIGDVVTTSTYNPDHGEVATEETWHDQNLLLSRTYVRDALGRITQVTEVVDDDGTDETTVFSYLYDDSGRLWRECRDDAQGDDACGAGTGLIAEYTYDPNGNRTARLIPGPGDEEAEYDAQDRLTEYADREYLHNLRGQLAAHEDPGGDWSFEYDSLGNLIQASQANGPTIDYLHDPLDRRIRRDDGETVRYWLYQDQLEPVAELNENRQLVARFVYGTRAHSPDYMIRFEGANQVLYRFVTDHLGSVRMVVNVSTGAVVQRLDYDAFGRISGRWPEQGFDEGFQPFGFAGGLHDWDTGLVRFGARDYDPYTGRWTAKDPIRWAGGQANLYEYVSSDPVNWIDRTGLESVPPDLAALLGERRGLIEAMAAMSEGTGDAATIGSLGTAAGGVAAAMREIAERCTKTGGRLALGLGDRLDVFAKQMGATTWKNFPDPSNWRRTMLQKLNDPDVDIVFNLDGVEAWPGASRATRGTGGATDWELLQIKQNPQWWPRITWWKDGTQVPNPFE